MALGVHEWTLMSACLGSVCSRGSLVWGELKPAGAEASLG